MIEKIKSIEPVKIESDLYDLSVDKNNNFYANNILVHNCQTCAKLLMEHFDEEWYISEKLDGQSATFFTYHRKTWGFWNKKFGVCSRKIWLKTPGSNNYWNVAQKFDIGKKLLNRHATTVVQGEILAPGVQANKYKMTDKEFFIFNIFEDGKMLSLEDMEYVCQELGLRTVPILNRSFIPSKVFGEGKEVSEIVRGMIEMSQGDSELLKRKREGIVVRLKSNPNISFKVINPYFSIEEE